MSRPLPSTTLPAIAVLVAARPELAGVGLSDALQVVTA